MAAFLGALDALLTVTAGAALLCLVRARLTLLERVLAAMVAGVMAGIAATYGLALGLGLNAPVVLASPALVALIGAGAAQLRGDALGPWRHSWADAGESWRAHRPWAGLTIGLLAIVLFALLFAHTVYSSGGAVAAGYPTVWADWSQHLSTAASFAVGDNLPPQNPLLSGTPLLYPFVPDFHAATLMPLGLSPGAALAAPSALLVIVCAMLIVALALRLGASVGAGVIAALVCFLGGGIGFEAVFADACVHHGFAVAQCTLQHTATHPLDSFGVVFGTLHDLPGTIAAQTRAYDGLPSGGGPAPFADMQWYTPLLAWWLPQRTFAYGFAIALVVFILVAAGWRERTRSWGTFIVAGALLGVLPLVHAQTLIAGALILLVLALRHRRIEWLALLAVTALVATPRLVQIAGSAHGAAAFGNVYPWLRPGWFANMGTSTNPSGRLDMSAGNLVVALLQGVQQLFTPGWWGFWIANLGVAVPLCFVLLVGAVVRLFPDAFGDPGRRLTSAFPPAVFEFFLASMLVFALCDVVVVSSWDWDNTKLLVYWYLAVGLLAGTLATHWWRRWWRALAATALVVSMLFTGTLVALRLGPWTPPAVATTNRSNTITGPDEVALAAYLEAHTARNAVFLTFGRPNDPVLALAGRPGVMGYYGWLWSYGIDFGSRYSDVLTMYKGCAAAQPCAVRELLRRYHVSYVEIDNRLNDPGAIQPATDLRWWATQGFPVVASTQNITVYDVRGRG